jgi:type I restriction-modification system DNA methylase subunit
MTRDQIQSVLRQTYDPQRWLEVLRAILPGTDVFANPQAVPATTPDAPQAVQLARVRLGDRKQLAVLQVRVGDRIDLLRNRVGLRNLVARFIDQAEYHGVLAVFLSPQNDFRFTFAARMAEFDDDGNLVRRETAPRRYTYVLGPNESCRTAAERFLQLSEKGLGATMEDVIEAFSVEKLNREFFSDFSTAFDRVKSEIQKRNKWPEKVAKEEAQTLLNRLVFLYFVQRKGWLNRQRDYLFRNFGRFADDAANKTTFIESFLRPLFTKLSTEGTQADIPGHDLPFLNGGLFADEYGDEHHDEVARRHHELQISNGVIQSVFDDLLERYNFTIQEDSPTNYEVAIDPEMLGQIFEELILTSEDSETAGKSKRHDTGSHYTRRPIVHYLCRDSLAAWLESQPPFVGKEDAPQRVRKLLALDATEGIDDETRNALKEILTPDEAAILLDRLFELRACDPAVGSGAFPMGLLHELVNLARLCATRAAGKDPVLGDRSWLYATKKRIIERVIYGVDIQPQAVDICKLRLWLSLMVDYELSADPDNCEATSFRKALKEIEPLPNLDFKIRRANSLVDYIHGEPVELKQLSSESGAAFALSKLSTAKREFFNARTAAAKRKLRLDIYENITELAKIELTRARTDAAGLGFALDERDAERVAELDNGLKQLALTTAQVRAARKMKAQAQEEALERIRAQFDDPDKPTFVWQLDFAEVFHRDETPRGDSLLPGDKPDKSGAVTTRNGFDLAIGNPPYIRIQTLTKSDPKLAAYYKQRYQSAGKGNYDLYVCFVERGLELLHQNGQLAYIQPHKFFNAQYGEPLRELLAKGKNMRHVVHFGDQQIFPGATNYVCLLFLAKAGVANCRFVKVDNLNNWLATLAGTEADIPAAKMNAPEWNFAVGKGSDLFERLQQLPVKLEHVTHRIFQGVKTSADKIYIVEELNRTKKSVRIFSPHTEKEHELEPDLLHPLIKGGDSKAFTLSRTQRLILFPYEKGSDGDSALIPAAAIKKRFPLTWAYLEENRDYLAGREDGRMEHDGWHGYIYPKALDVMPLPKIFTPDIAPRAAFSYDPTGEVFFTGGVAGGYGLLPKPPMCAEMLLGILNSTVLDFYHHRIASQMRGGWFSYESRFIKNLPIAPSSPAQQAVLIRLSEWLLWLHAQPSVAESSREHPVDPDIAAYIEQWVNALVYELYFPAEIQAAGLRFFELTESLKLPAPDSLPTAAADRLERFRKLHKEWSGQGHRLRIALDKLRTLDLVRTIEGQA